MRVCGRDEDIMSEAGVGVGDTRIIVWVAWNWNVVEIRRRVSEEAHGDKMEEVRTTGEEKREIKMGMGKVDKGMQRGNRKYIAECFKIRDGERNAD